jgi:signal transduction histidine kinase
VLQEERMSSELVVPLIDEGGPVGILNIESSKINAFTEHHQELLQAIANQAAVAIKMQKTRNQLALQESVNEGVIETNEIMHAIGNLIDPIKFPLESVVQTKKLDMSTKESINRALSAVEELYNLKEELLTPVRELNIIPLAVNEVTQNVLERLEAVLRKEEVEILVDVTDGTPLVLADKRALINVLMNLVGNAVDAMAEKKNKTLVIHAYKEPMSEMTRIDIEDFGRGIPSAIREEIWRPLFSRKTVKKGTGLGLYTCRRLIVRMKGEIFVHKTEIGLGSVFSLRLKSVEQ